MSIITESQWVNYFGFQRFPFDRPEAGSRFVERIMTVVSTLKQQDRNELDYMT